MRYAPDRYEFRVSQGSIDLLDLVPDAAGGLLSERGSAKKYECDGHRAERSQYPVRSMHLALLPAAP